MSHSALYPLIWKIRRVFQQLRNVSDTMLEASGINASERAVLESLSAEQGLSVPQIAKHLSVSRQHIQVQVNQLLTKGLVETTENPLHKRSPLLGLTASGGKLFASISQREFAMLGELQAHFSGTDIAVSLRTMEKLEELLQSKGTEG